MNRHFALKANRIGTSKEYTTNALKRCSILDTQNLIQMLSRAPVTLRYFTSEARNSQTSTKDLNGKLTEQELLERMNTLGTVPFRKITVADVLRPGRKPSLATCLQTCRITADELSVRLSRRVYEINNLPKDIRANPVTSGIVDIYKQTCRELFEYTRKVEYLRRNPPPPHPLQKAWNKLFGIKYEQREIAPKDQDLENIKYGHECTDPVLLQHLKPLTFEFIQLLKTIVKRHQPIIDMWAQEYPKLSLHRLFTENEIQSFLQRFHFQRIAVRLLIAHCVALYNPLPFDNMIGVFSIKTPIQKIIYEAVDMAYEICNNTYGMAPLVIVKPAAAEQDVFFIPSHLQHIIFELVKNAMRAVIEAHEQRNSIKSTNLENSTGEGRLKPILISWRYDSEDVIISIKDEGLGIPPELLQNVFLYHYTTANPRKDGGTVMAGYGYGLPLSRLYARFLKGDLWLETGYGQGTTSVVKLKGKWNPLDLFSKNPMTMEFEYEYKMSDLHLNINGISIVVTREVNSKADVILLCRPHFRNTELNHKTIISSAQIGQIVGFDGLVYNQAYKYKDLTFKVEASSVYWCNFIINLPNGQAILIINSLLQDHYLRLYPQRKADFVFDNVDEQQRMKLSQLAFAVGELRSIGGSKPTSFQNIAMQMVATLKKQETVYFKCTLDDLIATVEYIIGVMESTNMKSPVFMVGLDLLDLLMRPIRPDILLQPLQDKMWNGKFPFQYMEYIEEKKMQFISPKDLVKVSGAAVIISMLDLEHNGLNVAIGDKKTSILARESVPRLCFEHKFHSLKRFGNNIFERKPGMLQLLLPNTEYYYVDHNVLDCTVEKGYVNYTLQQNKESINRQDKKLKLMETSSISLDALK